MIKVFIDGSGWYAILQPTHDYHDVAKEYFQQILDTRVKLYTNILELSSTISKTKGNCGLSVATDFYKIIDQSDLSSNLNVSWITRRQHRSALKLFFTIKDADIRVSHCLIFEEVRKKKINFIFSFDNTLKSFGIPLMPQT
jgi:predicted nucleic acid-binding protein